MRWAKGGKGTRGLILSRTPSGRVGGSGEEEALVMLGAVCRRVLHDCVPRHCWPEAMQRLLGVEVPAEQEALLTKRSRKSRCHEAPS